MAKPFYGARLKIERAKHHINDLNLKAQQFGDLNPHTISIKNDDETGDDFICISPANPLPDKLLPILGDAIHNIRAALDFAWYDMSLAPHDRSRFPIQKTQKGFEDSINGAKKNTPKEIISFLIDHMCSPTKEGMEMPFGNWIVLDVTDKHKLLITHFEWRTVAGLSAIDERGAEILRFRLAHPSRSRCFP